MNIHGSWHRHAKEASGQLARETRLPFSLGKHSNMKISHSALPRTAGITVLWLSWPLFPTKSNRTSNSINKTAASRVEPSHFGLFQTVLQAQACFPNRIFSYFCVQRKREQAMRRLIFGDCPHNWLSTARAARGRNRSFPYETSSFAFHLFLKSICSTSNGFTLSLIHI